MSGKTATPKRRLRSGWVRVRNSDNKISADVKQSHIVEVRQNRLEGYGVHLSEGKWYFTPKFPLWKGKEPVRGRMPSGWVRIRASQKELTYIQLSHIVSIEYLDEGKYDVHLSNGRNYEVDKYPL